MSPLRLMFITALSLIVMGGGSLVVMAWLDSAEYGAFASLGVGIVLMFAVWMRSTYENI